MWFCVYNYNVLTLATFVTCQSRNQGWIWSTNHTASNEHNLMSTCDKIPLDLAVIITHYHIFLSWSRQRPLSVYFLLTMCCFLCFLFSPFILCSLCYEVRWVYNKQTAPGLSHFLFSVYVHLPIMFISI